ncbi:glycosyl transferase family 28 [Clostridium gasigenes]|uniref:glycosyltransferase n=1 Tax=Clostridium gasigenes TaxID=94869 RepID=UPI001C0C8DDA|nr:glycosyltransferase [Clostridium gasigenes]MBU3134088.1 glycosyl transferase family 28 [Clostridium gasigenes]
MIFATVGTHEQGLDRLLIELDRLIEQNIITEEVFAQIGYSEYKPKNYKYEEMIGYDEMDSYVRKASIVITHGGPGSIFHPLQYGKIPVVVPRNPKYKEHVDNHQILFTKRLEQNNRVLAIYDVQNLGCIINDYKNLVKNFGVYEGGNKKFIVRFSNLICEVLKTKS